MQKNQCADPAIPWWNIKRVKICLGSATAAFGTAAFGTAALTWFSGILVIASTCALVSCDSNSRSTTEEFSNNASPTRPSSVRLVIEFPANQSQFATELDWREGLTVFDAIISANDSHAELRVQSRGSGEIAFVYEIGGVANSGAQGKNWIYLVNGKLANVGCGAYVLRRGDSVLWKYGDYP